MGIKILLCYINGVEITEVKSWNPLGAPSEADWEITAEVSLLQTGSGSTYQGEVDSIVVFDSQTQQCTSIKLLQSNKIKSFIFYGEHNVLTVEYIKIRGDKNGESQ